MAETPEDLENEEGSDPEVVAAPEAAASPEAANAASEAVAVPEVVASSSEVVAASPEVVAASPEVVAAPVAVRTTRADRIAVAEVPTGGHGGSEGGEKVEITDKVVFINRCAKVVKGGRRFSFSALVVAGNHRGKVGYGFGKANEVSDAIKKASELAKGSLVSVCLTENTITHEVMGVHGGGRVLLRPAVPGTGIIAGGGVRAVCEAAGIHDLLGKSLGSKNPANVVKATINALLSLRTKDEIYRLRGRKTPEKKAL